MLSIQCSGSVTFRYLWLTDPDPSTDPPLFVSDLQDANRQKFGKKFFAKYFLKVHLHHSSQIKSHKKSENRRNFCLMMKVSGSGSESGSVLRTNESGSGKAQKLTYPTDPHSDTEHWCFLGIINICPSFSWSKPCFYPLNLCSILLFLLCSHVLLCVWQKNNFKWYLIVLCRVSSFPVFIPCTISVTLLEGGGGERGYVFRID